MDNIRKLHFVFKIYLLFDNDYRRESLYPTKNRTIDGAVQKFLNSSKLIYVIDSIIYDYKLLDYYIMNNLLHVFVDTKTPLSMNKLGEKLYDIDPDGNAPDLWMESDISITNNIEFLPRLYKLYVLSDDETYERQLDLNSIPEYTEYKEIGLK
jgi:hypothetical protein